MTALTPEETDVLKHLLAALGDAGQEFIIAGGQAARLFRFHPLAQPLAWQPILTQDIDVATIDKGHRAERDIGEALEREGFASHLDGEDVPPLTHYRLGTSEVEFIVPDIPRRNTTGATVSVLGASAQKVANLEPLLVQPIELIIPDVGSVRLPNPAAYLIQKVLTLSARRTLGKKGKDALYVHDVLLLFTHGNRLHPEIVASARRVLGTLTKKQVKRLRENAQKLGDAGVDFVVESARQAEGCPTSITRTHRVASAADVTSETHQNHTLSSSIATRAVMWPAEASNARGGAPRVDSDKAKFRDTQLWVGRRSSILEPARGLSFFRASAEIVVGAVERLGSHWSASAETASSPAMNTSFRAAARRQSLSLRWSVRSWASGYCSGFSA